MLFDSQAEGLIRDLSEVNIKLQQCQIEIANLRAGYKALLRELLDNRPDTYSGTDIDLQQKKMFAFQRAVMQAETILKE